MSAFNVQSFRTNFPILHNHLTSGELVYFDNAATTQKPQCVIDGYLEYYARHNANVHRASHQLSSISTAAFEKSREMVKRFINACHLEEVIWTKGTTESFNLLSQSLGQLIINEGDEIILSQSEHHANIVPWQLLAEQKKAHIKILPLTECGTINVELLEGLITKNTKIVSFAHISNVIGKVNPIEKIVELCKKHNVISVVDGAQAIGHFKVDVQELGCDFYLFSAHKMYGPTGVGVLYGKRGLLNRMPPYQGGGEMIQKVSFSGTTYNRLPFKFEPGTPNIAGIIAFSSALEFIETQTMKQLTRYEETLTNYCYQQLKNIESVNFIVDEMPDIPLFSFTISGHHNHDVASYLDAQGIAVRAGHHCAMPLMEYLNLAGCVRVSLAAYNTFEEVDYFIASIIRLIESEEALHEVDISPPKPLQANNQLSASDIIVNTFSTLKSWDSRHREIMMMGKRHTRMPNEFKNELNIIGGCESDAWLSYKLVDRKYIFTADSDAKVVRGLLTIVLAAFNGKTCEEIRAFDIKDYFEKLGLQQHLSPSRANGLNAIVTKILAIIEIY
jgi:SufS family cysteine desulfurase